MRIFVTGGTGVLGSRVVAMLAAGGHDVVATARGDQKAGIVRDGGGTPVDVDLLDVDALKRAIDGCQAVLRLATKIPSVAEMRSPSAWQANDRVRREGSKALIDAVLATGVESYLQESVTFVYDDGGEEWIDETGSLAPLANLVSALEAEAESLRAAEAGVRAVTLRFGMFYAADASREAIELLRTRRFPIIGTGQNFTASIHADDAAAAVVAALHAPTGLYNVVDDDPLRQMDYANVAAEALGAKSPRRVPWPVVRLALGKGAGVLVRSARVSNARMKETTGWAPRYPSARKGWAQVAKEVIA